MYPTRSLLAPVLVWCLALAVLALFAGERELFDQDEGRYGAIGLDMARTGDWVTPRLDDMPFLDKPPLIFHVQAALLTALPPSPLVARAPSLLAGAFLVLFVFLFAQRLGAGDRAARIAAGVSVTSAGVVLGSRFGPTADLPLAACVAGALLAALAGVTRAVRTGAGPGVGAAAGLGLAIGLGLLAKGPLVVAVALVVAVGWVLAGVDPRAVLRTAVSPLAWLVALVVAAPWYVLVEQAHPGWIRHFVEYEHFGRFGRGDHRDFAPVWFYVPVALLYLVPFTHLLFAPSPVGAGRLRRLARPLLDGPWAPRGWTAALSSTLPLGRGGAGVAAGRLAFAWFVLGFLLYSASTRKLLNYLLPAAPPLFLLAGVQLDRLADRRTWLVWLPIGVGIATVLLGISVWLGVVTPLATGALPTVVEAPRSAPLAPFAIAAGCLLVAASLIAARAGRPAVWLVVGAAVFWLSLDLGFARASDLGSARGLAAAIEREAKPGTPIVTWRRYPQGLGYYRPGGVFMAGGEPGAFRQREIVEPYASAYWRAQSRDASGVPVWTGRGGLLSRREFEILWARAERALVVCRYAEIRSLRGRIVSGPHAGAARTDLFLIDNGRD